MSKNKRKSIKAEITVVFKTCNLIETDEFESKYQSNIENLISEILENFTLNEITDNEYVILKIKKI